MAYLKIHPPQPTLILRQQTHNEPASTHVRTCSAFGLQSVLIYLLITFLLDFLLLLLLRRKHKKAFKARIETQKVPTRTSPCSRALESDTERRCRRGVQPIGWPSSGLEQTLLSASDSAAEPSEAFLADDFFLFRFFFTLFFSPCADQQETREH